MVFTTVKCSKLGVHDSALLPIMNYSNGVSFCGTKGCLGLTPVTYLGIAGAAWHKCLWRCNVAFKLAFIFLACKHIYLCTSKGLSAARSVVPRIVHKPGGI